MSWSNLKANDWPTRGDAQDAVDNGIFLANNGVPATQPNEWVTGSQAKSYVKLKEAEIPAGYENNWLPKKYWIGDFPIILQDVTGLASPRQMAYDPVNKIMYYLDNDDPNAGIKWFDPLTLNDASDIHDVAGTINAADNTASAVVGTFSYYYTGIVYYNGKIYAHGNFTSGCQVIDCATKTITKTVTYGTNQDYYRQQLILIGSRVWAYDTAQGAFQIIDTATDTIVTMFNTDAIPSVTGNSSKVLEVGTDVWIVTSNNDTSSSAYISIYPKTGFVETSPSNQLALPFTQAGQNGKVLVDYIYYDEDNDLFYVHSSGDNAIAVYKGSTEALFNTITITMVNSNIYSSFYPVVRKNTGQLYFSGYQFGGTNADKTYEIDRVNATILDTKDIRYGDMTYVADTAINYTTLPFETYPDTGYNTDGKIQLFN